MANGIIILAIILTFHQCKMYLFRTVNVSELKIEQSSSHDNEQSLSTKLAGKIMENFAKKYKLNVKYDFINQTLHEILENEEHLENIPQS